VRVFRSSAYNCIWEADGDYYVYNSLTDGLVSIPASLGVDMLSGTTFEACDEIAELVDGLFLVSDSTDDFDMYVVERGFMRSMTKDLCVFITPTTACNLVCPYCVQSNFLNMETAVRMSGSTLAQVGSWLASKSNSWGTQHISVILYGGEPLLERDIVFGIADELAKLPVKVSYNCITNGTMLKDYDFSRLPFSMVQVTLDGPRDIHNRRRCGPHDDDTFSAIVEGASEYLNASPKNRLTIRINVDKENRTQLLDLVSYLAQRLPVEQVTISPAPVDPWAPDVDDRAIHGNIDDTAHAIAECLRKSDTLGFRIASWSSRCGIGSMGMYAIDVNGYIHKCPGMSGMNGLAVGHVSSLTFNHRFYELMNATVPSECHFCKFLGICEGGCLYQRMVNGKGKHHKRNCRYRYYELMIPVMMGELEKHRAYD